MKKVISTYIFSILLTGCISSESIKPTPQNENALDISSYKVQRVLNDENCAIGCPSGGGETTIQRQVYTLNNNEKTKFANWVAYTVRSNTIGSGKERNWKKDPNLGGNETLTPADYKNANKVLGVDRGHQAPLASLAGLSNWHELNYLSNITPQKASLNRGAWARIEEQERKLARQGHTVFTVTGTLYEKNIGVLPNTKKEHKIPSGYWKAIFLDRTPYQSSYAAFILDQDTPKNADFCQYQVTVNEIENRSNLKLWSLLDDNTQSVLKTESGKLAEKMGCENIG